MFNGWTVLEMILGGAGGVFLVGLLAVTWKCGHGLVTTIKETATNVKVMKEDNVKRKEESKMLFKGILTICGVMKGDDMNGNITELQAMYDDHFVNGVS